MLLQNFPDQDVQVTSKPQAGVQFDHASLYLSALSLTTQLHSLCNPNVQCHNYRSSSIIIILSRINSTSHADLYSLETHSNIVLPYIPRPSKMSPLCEFACYFLKALLLSPILAKCLPLLNLLNVTLLNILDLILILNLNLRTA